MDGLKGRKLITLVVLIIISLSIFSTINSQLINTTEAHSTISYTSEIFSIWENDAPIIDGTIEFNFNSSIISEWGNASIYNLYNSSNDIYGKFLLQNDNSNLYIGIDAPNFIIDPLPFDWGFVIYFDADHNGYLNSADRSIRFIYNTSDYVEFRSYNYVTKNWVIDYTGSLDSPLANNVLVSSSFTTCEFENETDHRQYEIKIPLTTISSATGDTFGFALEVTEDFTNQHAGMTWPFIDGDLLNIRTDANIWGDLSIGEENKNDFYFVVENNLNVKDSARGYNNGTYITSGDIDGNGDLELIVSSNRTVVGDRNLLTIYDYVGGEIYQNWTSWTTSHQSIITFVIQGLATHDFDGDGKDEIYAVGKTRDVLYFSDWNVTAQDFESSGIAFTVADSDPLMGYIAIGEVNNDTQPDIVLGDQYGRLLVYEYSGGTFVEDFRSGARFKINGVYPYRVHALAVGNVDGDMYNEILFNYQISPENDISETGLLIYQFTIPKFQDNPGDDLPADSSPTTVDNFGHTIVVGDVDNDLENEIVIVGQNYLRVFNNDSFSLPTPPLEMLINDGTSQPSMAGGATIVDLDDNGLNELVFSANNGTFYVGTVTDLGTTFNFELNRSCDFGSSLGYHGAMNASDFDKDGRVELAVGDNYGQIMLFGKGNAPDVTITSPNNNFVSANENIVVTWEATNDLQAIHHFDIKVNGVFYNRAGGGQRNARISLKPSQNNIQIIAYGFSGLSKAKSITVKFDVKAPQVTISSPENYFITDELWVDIFYSNYDPDDDFDYYEIYRNDSLIDTNVHVESYPIYLPNDGVWNITVFAFDDAGLHGRESVFVIRDRTGPDITINLPKDGVAVKVTDLDVSWSASDEFSEIDRYEVYRNGSFYQTVYSKSISVTLLADGLYTIEVIAFDDLGNLNSDSTTITKDTIAPTLTLDPISLPTLAGGTYYTNNPSLYLSWATIDNPEGSGIEETKITRNGLTIGTYFPAETSDTIDLGTDGLKNMVITTYDKAGNTDSVYFSVILDRATPYLTIQTPENHSLTGLDYVIVSWSAGDTGVGIKEFKILVDSIVIDTVENPTLTFYQVSLPDFQSYWITIRAIDYLDYSFEQTINVTKSIDAPTINVISPTNLYSYINTTTLQIDWDISNIVVDYFEVYINETSQGTFSSTTFSTILTFDEPLPGEYPVYNVTVYAFAIDLSIYFDLRWVILDKIAPTLIVITPEIDDVILISDMNVEWSGNDEGSNIASYLLKLAGVLHPLGPTIISHIIDTTGLDGAYDLTVVAYDVAGNKIEQIIPLTISLIAPGFITTLEAETITNNPEIQFTLSINEPRIGVKTITIMLDEVNEIYYINYEPTYLTTILDLLINITETDYSDEPDVHNLTIVVTDKLDRERKEQYQITIDIDPPSFWQPPIIGTNLLTNEVNEMILYNDTSRNIHNITVYILDGWGIQNVQLTITNENITRNYQLLQISGSRADTIFQYYVEIDFNEIGEGEFSFIFNFDDIAGNSNNIDYNIKMAAEVITPTPTPTTSPTTTSNDNNFLYIIIGMSVVVIAALVGAIALRQPISNLGWKEELVVISYILRSGLTALFIPYSYEIITDEQLFGGAMSGIRGILEEIIGRKSRDEVETVEFGNKNLLIYTGSYGDVILLVNKTKPIHARKLKQFAEEFEEKYAESLMDDTHVSMYDYIGAHDIIQKYFGAFEDTKALTVQLSEVKKEKIKLEFDSIKETETLVNSFYQEISSKYDSFDELSPETKILIGDAIILAEQAVTDLISGDFDRAEKKAKTALKSIQVTQERKEPLEKFNDLFSALPSIVDEVIRGANCGKRGHTDCVHKAIELASQLFLERITSRF